MTISSVVISPDGGLGSRRVVPESEVTRGAVREPSSEVSTSSVDMKAVAQELAETAQQLGRQTASNIEFSIDDESRRSVVKVLDGDSGEVLRQFPTEEALRVARQLVKSGSGLVQDKA